ncbi:hypothetical protein EPR50_G00057470 [Perca flavescens]|uniref:Uncharacterized protein n=2 Tax=Perca flavescens TaxID=8167 RepID=A0A484DDA1_PERFV|nr:hypothetical protein EPR50_G00057470 [Perca flavescens]
MVGVSEEDQQEVFRCSGAPPSPSAAPSSHSTQEAPSSSPSPPPTQHTTTPSQLSITLPTSCFLLQRPPTKEATAVFITSMFSLITSPLRALCSLSVMGKLTVYRIGEDDWSKLSENDQLTTCFWTDSVMTVIMLHVSDSNQTHTKCKKW